jgi:hypothetical protein
MNGKRKTATLTEGEAQSALRRGSGATLSGEEEKVMRMRLGASVPRADRLERVAVPGGARSDAAIELLAYEIEAYLKVREARRAALRAPSTERPLTARQQAKAKIIRELRKRN